MACDAAVSIKTVFLISTVPPIELLATMMTDVFAVKTVGNSPVVSMARNFRSQAYMAKWEDFSRNVLGYRPLGRCAAELISGTAVD